MESNITRRTAAVAESLRERGAGAFVVITDEDTNWENLYYLSGFRGTSGSLVIYADGDAELYLDGRYRHQGRAQSPHKVCEIKESTIKDAAESIKKRGISKILCEAGKTFHAAWEDLVTLSAAQAENGSEIIKELRRKKDENETAAVKKAAEIGAGAFLKTLEAVRPGMKEKEFEALLNYNICMKGGAPGFDMIVASGLRSVMPHGRASEKIMEKGEWVTVDFGARWEGYFCDITRNFSIGEPSQEARALHGLIAEAHRQAASRLCAGASGTALHETAAGIFSAAGKEEYFTHSLGHSFGLEIHEAPVLSPRRDDILREGDIVTVEPGLYIPDLGGMRLEDDYMVTKEGAMRLTEALPQKLFVV
ncbi:MAG: aminopeptidase P family protein [Synergistes sp.]|nr:aminopeptidase P family protein [Synergistes sp.]